VDDTALWKHFSATTHSKLKSAYNECTKKMFGYTRRDGMTGVFLDLSLPSWIPLFITPVFSLQTSLLDRVTRLYNGF